MIATSITTVISSVVIGSVVNEYECDSELGSEDKVCKWNYEMSYEISNLRINFLYMSIY
jgi:hypothetical protein